MSYFVAIIIAALGSTGLFSLIEHIMDNRSGRNKELKEIRDELKEIRAELKETRNSCDESRQDTVRLQLLNLIQHTPYRESEILTVAKKYFDDLNGNWYMESIFTEWAEEQNVPLPSWFKG